MDNANDGRAMWLSLAIGVIAATCSVALAVQPRDGQQVVVLTWPWAGNGAAMRVIAAADAKIIASGRTDWIAVAEDARPNLVRRLYGAGAAFVADAAFAKACGNLVTQGALFAK